MFILEPVHFCYTDCKPHHHKKFFRPAGGQIRKGGSGGKNFCPLAHRAEGAAGVGGGSSLRQQRGKARKNYFLN